MSTPAAVYVFSSGHTLYLGDRHHAKDLHTLRRLGIQHVLNCTPSREVGAGAGCPNFFHKERDFTYMRCAVFDTAAADLRAHFDACANFIERAQFYSSVLVHCHRGQSRSAAMVMAFLMRAQGLNVQSALARCQKVRPAAAPNPSFMKQLREFSEQLAAARKAKEAKGISRDAQALYGNGTPGLAASPSPADAQRHSHKPKNACARPRADQPCASAAPVSSAGHDTASSIGPRMPPSERSIGCMPPPSERSIGPSMPPSSEHKDDDVTVTEATVQMPLAAERQYKRSRLT